MRTLFLSVMMIGTLLARLAVAQTAPPVSDAATPSVLAPIMRESLPAPTPVAPEAAGQPAVPPAPIAAPSEPAPERGTITAVPLPPPSAAPVPAPMPPPVPTAVPGAIPPASPTDPAIATSPGAAPAAAAPVSLTPIPLALPRVTSPSPASSPPAAKSPAAPLVSARLPTPPLSSEASPADFLRAARGALAAGRNGEARSALEMAQTRLLDRSVDAGKESVPSHDLAVKQISEAIDALAADDRMACLRYIEFASQTIGSPLD
jgi:hypothetical protein